MAVIDAVRPADTRLDEQRPAARPLPTVLDLGRQIVGLSNKGHELELEQIALHGEKLPIHEKLEKERKIERAMGLAFDRECALVDVALGMRAHTMGDVAVMLGLAWRVLDLGATCEFDEKDRARAIRQIRHALLTSLG